MIQEYQLRVLPEVAANEQRLKEYLIHEKGLNAREITAARILKRSIDARQRTIYINLNVRAYLNEMPKEERVKLFGDYHVNRDMMQLGNLGCKVLHCLPCTRGEDVTDEVADSAASLCWEEAWNRLTAMRGLLVYFTREKKSFSEIAKAAAKAELESVLDSMGIVY